MTAWQELPQGSWTQHWEGRGAMEGNPHHGWSSKPPSPRWTLPTISHCCVCMSQLLGLDRSWEHPSHVMEGVLPAPWRLSGQRSCQPPVVVDYKPLSRFLPGNKLLVQVFLLRGHAYQAGGNVICTATLENWLFLIKPNIHLPYNPATSVLGI